jgi:hypothetical protein
MAEDHSIQSNNNPLDRALLRERELKDMPLPQFEAAKAAQRWSGSPQAGLTGEDFRDGPVFSSDRTAAASTGMKDIPPAAQVLERIERSQMELDAALERLATRLQPVSVPREDQKSTDPTTRPVSGESSLLRSLDTVAYATQRQISIVMGIISRLEV